EDDLLLRRRADQRHQRAPQARRNIDERVPFRQQLRVGLPPDRFLERRGSAPGEPALVRRVQPDDAPGGLELVGERVQSRTPSGSDVSSPSGLGMPPGTYSSEILKPPSAVRTTVVI